MRNLAVSTTRVSAIQAEDVTQLSSPTSEGASAVLSAIAFDVDRDALFAATESGCQCRRYPGLENIGKGFSSCGWSFVCLLRLVFHSEPSYSKSQGAFRVESTGYNICVLLQRRSQGDVEVQGTVEPGIAAAAWSPDDSLLTLVTGALRPSLFHRSLTCFHGSIQRQTHDSDAPINVGWGSKETQMKISTTRIDHALPGVEMVHYFAVSTRSSQPPSRRVIRVYSHEGRLQSTSEAVPGLEASAAWRPNGGLIASTQNEVRLGPQDARKSGKHDVVFFERNGLRHGEFSLRRPPEADGSHYKIKDLIWSSDSAVLAVWIEKLNGDIVQLWTTGNYHWYLKQEFQAPDATHFTSVAWHPEVALQLVMATPSQLIIRTFAWETCAVSSMSSVTVNSSVLSTDQVLLTPFRTQNVPPPMSSSSSSNQRTPHTQTPVHVSLSPSNDLLAIIWQRGCVAVWSLRTRIGPGKGKVMNPLLIWTTNLGDGDGLKLWRQVTVSRLAEDEKSMMRVTVLGSGEGGIDQANIHEIRFDPASEQKPESEESWIIKMPGSDGRLVSSYDYLPPFWQAFDGEIFEDSRLFVGLAHLGKLSCVTPGSTSALLASNANSFAVASGFVVSTTTAHEAQFAPVAMLVQHLESLVDSEGAALALDAGTGPAQLSSDSWEKRRVERGSRIVTVVPSTMSLVLQMPRGNLETINPRPLVMEVVKNDLDSGRWKTAFLSCRKHRIDLSIIVQHNQDAFMDGVSVFIDQVQDVDYINLFLTNIGRSQLSQKTIADVCDAVRHELEIRDLAKYVNSILTAYVVKSPPDHEAGLAMLLRLRDSQPDLVEDAVKYIIFLVDADKLFDTALGMYDFSLVLMVAQYAQKDPREYLPFLRELRALPQFYQRFKIDDHLRRYAKALSNLHHAGPNYFQEALEYLEHHQLYDEGLAIWQDSEQHQAVLNAYGSWLFDRRDYKQAALVFAEASDFRKAMIAHERALEWQELFELSTKENIPQEEVKEIAYRITEELLSKKRFPEAARVFVDYAGDIRQAAIALVQGNEFSEARRIVSLYAKPELLEDVILPGAFDIRSQLADDLAEIRDHLHKQVARLAELRLKKAEEPDAFYGTEDANLHNVDVMTDVSMAPSMFTRYTVAASATSKASNSKTKRKMERKVGSGRKGTVDEEEYLLKSVCKLVTRCTAARVEVKKLLPHLLQLSKEHRAEGTALQQEFGAFDQELRKAVEEIWTKPGGAEEPTPVDSWMTRMQEREKERLIDPIERVPKPEMEAVEWGLKLL
ncbi:pol II transcription elongation factor [Melanogaster broomeanus]|nr:pol II transcription elongation factor [Melanogaster broomeanus]